MTVETAYGCVTKRGVVAVLVYYDGEFFGLQHYPNKQWAEVNHPNIQWTERRS